MPRPPKNPEERLIKLSEDEARRLIKFYGDAERDILAEINKALLKGNQTKYLKAMQKNVQVILKDLRDGSRTWCETAIPRVYIEGATAADMQMEAQGTKVKAGFAGIHQQAAQVLAESAGDRFDDVTTMIGRRINDIYRTVALENIRGSVIGYQSWQKVARNYRDQLAEQGITGFTDRAGRQWNMKTYAEMVSRTTTMEAHLEGTKNRLMEHGYDLIKVSSHANACPKCQPWQGKILSLSGNDKDYPGLDEAKAAGLFHPRCRHAYGLYIDLEDEAMPEPKPGKQKKVEPPPTARQLDPKLQNLVDSVKGIGPAAISNRRGFATKLLDSLGLNHVSISVKSINVHGRCEFRVDSSDKIHMGNYLLNSRDLRSDAHKIKTSFHEVFHAKADGLKTDYNRAKPEWINVEEVFAESSSHFLYQQMGVDQEIAPSYPERLVEFLPRLKQLDKFKGCKKLTDFGEIAWTDRLNGLDPEWEDLYKQCMAVNYNWTDLLLKHKDYIDANKDELLDLMLENMPQYKSYKSDMADDYQRAVVTVARGGRLSNNENMVTKNLLAIVINRLGVD